MNLPCTFQLLLNRNTGFLYLPTYRCIGRHITFPFLPVLEICHRQSLPFCQIEKRQTLLASLYVLAARCLSMLVLLALAFHETPRPVLLAVEILHISAHYHHRSESVLLPLNSHVLHF